MKDKKSILQSIKNPKPRIIIDPIILEVNSAFNAKITIDLSKMEILEIME